MKIKLTSPRKARNVTPAANSTAAPKNRLKALTDTKPAAKPAKAAKTPKTPKGRVFDRNNFDMIPFMVTPRVPQRAIIKAYRNKPMPEADPESLAFLVATGPKGTYISAIMTDNGDFYSRTKRVGGLAYGQLSLLPKMSKKDPFTLEVLDEEALVNRVKKLGRVVTFARQSDKTDVTVALASPMDSDIMCGVLREGKTLRVVTMHSAGKTSAPSNEQYGNPRDSKSGKAFIASLVALTK